jgi:hypothetical protein
MPEGPPAIQLASRKAVRAEWADPEDVRPNVRSGRTVRGHRAYDPLRWCRARHGERSSFTDLHIEAADRLRGCFDASRLGFSSIKDGRPIGSVQFRPSQGPTQAAVRQWQAARQFAAAWSLCGEQDRASWSPSCCAT